MSLLSMAFCLGALAICLAAAGLGALICLLTVALTADITQRARGTGLSTLGKVLTPAIKPVPVQDPLAGGFGPPEPEPIDPSFLAAARQLDAQLISAGHRNEVP